MLFFINTLIRKINYGIHSEFEIRYVSIKVNLKQSQFIPVTFSINKINTSIQLNKHYKHNLVILESLDQLFGSM